MCVQNGSRPPDAHTCTQLCTATIYTDINPDGYPPLGACRRTSLLVELSRPCPLTSYADAEGSTVLVSSLFRS